MPAHAHTQSIRELLDQVSEWVNASYLGDVSTSSDLQHSSAILLQQVRQNVGGGVRYVEERIDEAHANLARFTRALELALQLGRLQLGRRVVVVERHDVLGSKDDQRHGGVDDKVATLGDERLRRATVGAQQNVHGLSQLVVQQGRRGREHDLAQRSNGEAVEEVHELVRMVLVARHDEAHESARALNVNHERPAFRQRDDASSDGVADDVAVVLVLHRLRRDALDRRRIRGRRIVVVVVDRSQQVTQNGRAIEDTLLPRPSKQASKQVRVELLDDARTTRYSILNVPRQSRTGCERATATHRRGPERD